jgi:DNA-binding LacI/PurR family transcriptional regulator
MATIRDVARMAGVNHTTVSHALSGKRPVAAATRDRVLAAIQQLGYHPNAAAQSLVSRRTRTVGLVAPLDGDLHDLAESGYSQFITFVADRLGDHDYRLLCLVARDPDPFDVVRLVRSGQVDGMLQLQVRVEDARVAVLRQAGLPFVAIGRTRESTGLVRADADFVTAGEIAVRHLAGLGHRRIALLSATEGGHPFFGYQYHTLAGFRRAHRALGLRAHRAQVLGYDPRRGLERTLDPLFGANAPTALIATTPIEAVFALRALAAHGLRVPDDLSLVAIGDTMLAELAQPPLTVVRFSPAQLTAVAVDLLVGMLAGQQPARLEHLVPVELVPRESTRRIGPSPAPENPFPRAAHVLR